MSKEFLECPRCKSKRDTSGWAIPLIIGGCCSILLIGIPLLPVGIILSIVFAIMGTKYCGECKYWWHTRIKKDGKNE